MTDNEGRSQNNAERDAAIYQLITVQCWSQGRVAQRYGISTQRVSQIIAEQRAQMPPVDLGALRDQALKLHEDVIRRAYVLADMRGAPVTAGKDGDVVLDPEDGAVVRDHSLQVAALRTALDADKERRKLMGLDAATKIESAATVRYVLEGVNTDDLA